MTRHRWKLEALIALLLAFFVSTATSHHHALSLLAPLAAASGEGESGSEASQTTESHLVALKVTRRRAPDSPRAWPGIAPSRPEPHTVAFRPRPTTITPYRPASLHRYLNGYGGFLLM